MSILQRIRNLVMGQPNPEGRIDPKRPAIIIGVAVLLVVILTVITDGEIWGWLVVAAIVVGFYGGAIVLLGKGIRLARKEEKIRVTLSSASDMSTYDIAQRSGLSVDEVESLLPRMIAAANSGKKAVSRANLPNATSGKFLRNAKLDLVTHKVTLAPNATEGRLAQLGAAAGTLLRRNVPGGAPARLDWRCEYCRTANAGDAEQCVNCRAGRPA